MPGTGRDELADDDVLLQPEELVGAAVDGCFGEHPGRLLEGGGRQPRVRGKRRLRDPHELRAPLGGALRSLHELPVDGRVPLRVDALTGKEGGVAGLGDEHTAQHLADDELDVLVVDRHTLVAVHLLHLFDEVLLGLADALDLEELLRVLRAFHEGVARVDLLAVGDFEVCACRQRDDLLVAVLGNDGHAAPGLVLVDAHDAGLADEHGGTLRGTGLEELDDSGKTVGDVLTDDATGVERTHRELGTRLTDRLGGDDPDRLAELDLTPGRQ